METLQIENCQKTSYIYIKKWPEYILFQCWTPRLGLIVWTAALRTQCQATQSFLRWTVGVMLLPEATVYTVNHSTTVFVTTL